MLIRGSLIWQEWEVYFTWDSRKCKFASKSVKSVRCWSVSLNSHECLRAVSAPLGFAVVGT